MYDVLDRLDIIYTIEFWLKKTRKVLEHDPGYSWVRFIRNSEL